MYRISHIMHLEEDNDNFSIASYDLGFPNTIKTCPAISMKIVNCRANGAITNFLEAAWPANSPESLNEDFRHHYEQILKGQYGDWSLVSVTIRPGCLDLEYYSNKYDLSEIVRIDINDSRIRALDIHLEVPHSDSNSAADYLIMMEYSKHDAVISSSTIVQASFPHLHQRRVFMVTSLNPGKLSVTDLFDL